MKKKSIFISFILVIMILGVYFVSAVSTGTINVTSSTHLVKYYNASNSRLYSTITSMGYGSGTPGTYIVASLKNSSGTYVQKAAFKQDVGSAGSVTVKNAYVGIGNWKLELYGRNLNTGLNYADWSGSWSYVDN